jgi:two-component system, OmpR family, response regulator VicR
MKVLLIEDSPEIVKGVSLTFKLRWPDAEVVAAENGKNGIVMAQTETPDFIILDINLPDITGFEVLEQVRKFSDVPVIILTVREDEVDELRGLELGADDYIIKPFRPANLLTRMQAVLRRTSAQRSDENSPALTIGQISIDLAKQEIWVNSARVHLTRNESRILYCLARNAGKVVPQDILKQNVWGNEAQFVDNSALKRYIYQLRYKLGDNSEPPTFIINEHGIGYRLIRPELPPAST